MDTFDAIAGRRSIRKYTSEPISDEQVTKCLEAARQAPSGTNAQPWKLIVVRSPERRQALQDAAYGQKMFTQAPVVIALLGDTKVYRKRMRRGKELQEIGAIDNETIESITKAYGERSRDQDPTSGIMINCMLAGQNLVLAAADQGLGTCWVMLFDREKVTAALDLPKHIFPVALIPLGYSDQAPDARPRYDMSDVAFDETLERPWG